MYIFCIFFWYVQEHCWNIFFYNVCKIWTFFGYELEWDIYILRIVNTKPKYSEWFLYVLFLTEQVDYFITYCPFSLSLYCFIIILKSSLPLTGFNEMYNFYNPNFVTLNWFILFYLTFYHYRYIYKTMQVDVTERQLKTKYLLKRHLKIEAHSNSMRRPDTLVESGVK